MTSTEQLIAALERLDRICAAPDVLASMGCGATIRLRNALPALIELVKDYAWTADHLAEISLFNPEQLQELAASMLDQQARVLEAMGEGGEQ